MTESAPERGWLRWSLLALAFVVVGIGFYSWHVWRHQWWRNKSVPELQAYLQAQFRSARRVTVTVHSGHERVKSISIEDQVALNELADSLVILSAPTDEILGTDEYFVVHIEGVDTLDLGVISEFIAVGGLAKVNSKFIRLLEKQAGFKLLPDEYPWDRQITRGIGNRDLEASISTTSNVPMTPAPKHPRFRWSLRTMFVVVTVFAVATYVCTLAATLVPNDLTWAELSSIKPGMTESEVIELVGRPNKVHRGVDETATWYYGTFIPDWVELKDGRVVEAVRF